MRGRSEVGKQVIPFQLSNEEEQQPDCSMLESDIIVDLFEPSTAPRNAMLALEFYNRNPAIRSPTLEQIADHLGISKRGARLALNMRKEMQVKGLTDPFISLTEAPENASWWRPNQTV